jgi:hypothetical protein
MPLTTAQHEKSLKVPAVCELLPLRDILDNVMVRTNGAFVAGYELRGVLSYFSTDEDRNQAKNMIEALLRSIPDVSMRIQFRYELSDSLGALLDDYRSMERVAQPEIMALDTYRLQMWQANEQRGHYLNHRLHVYFIWDPRVHARLYHSAERKRKAGGLVLSQKKCIERAEKEHKALLTEFESIMRGIESSMDAAELGQQRLDNQTLFDELRQAQVPHHTMSQSLRRPEPDLVGKLRNIPVPFLGFRSADEQTDPAILISDGTEFLSLPTMSGDLRPYGALDRHGMASAQSMQSARRFYELAAAVSEALSE